MPLVSVVIPVYNAAPFLRQCLDSVLGQSLTDWEAICVDDGSTDESPTILNEYAQQDGRIKVLAQKNAGPGAARNAGLDRASGEYLIFLDADDWFEPDLLERMFQRAGETGADVTICRAVEFDTQSGQPLPSEWMLKERYLPGSVFPPAQISGHVFQFTYGWAWDKLYRTALIRKALLRFPHLYNSEDSAFVFPSLVIAELIAVLPSVLVHHRANRSSSVSNTRGGQPDAPYEALQIVKQFLASHGLMDLYQRSFLHWAMEFLVWHVCNLDDRTVQREYFHVLRKKWLPEFRFGEHPAKYYEDRRAYFKYVLARWAPWPVFYAAVQIQHRLKKKDRG